MNKVTDYKLVGNRRLGALEAEVKKHMKDGWVPSGTVVKYGDELVQAMVKFD